MGSDFSHYELDEAWNSIVHIWKCFFSQVHMIGSLWIIPFCSSFPQKLINISTEVMNIHIIPTQTKHFQTTYTKKVCFLLLEIDLNKVMTHNHYFWWLILFSIYFLSSIDLFRASLIQSRSNSVPMSGATFTTAFGFTARWRYSVNNRGTVLGMITFKKHLLTAMT